MHPSPFASAVLLAMSHLASAQTPTAQSPPIPTHYGYLIYPEFELLDVAGPVEALSQLSWHQSPMSLSFISNDTLAPVSNGYNVIRPNNHSFDTSLVPAYTLDTAPDDIDILMVPGGGGSRADVSPFVNFIKDRYPKLKYILSVCTGAGLLAQSGILDGRNATTNKQAWNTILPMGPNTNWIREARWVQDGNIWTTSGVSAGTDGTLALIEYLYGFEAANNVTQGMEWIRATNSTDDPFAVNIPDN